MLKHLSLLLAFSTFSQAAYFDSNGILLGNGLSETDQRISRPYVLMNQTWTNGVFLITGHTNNDLSCTGALIKTWSGPTPPVNSSAIGISAGRCFLDLVGTKRVVILRNKDLDYSTLFQWFYERNVNHFQQLPRKQTIQDHFYCFIYPHGFQQHFRLFSV